MASTQSLTELPVIQYTGMDYSTVISQIKEIIESNSNWSSNWTEFYNSEAGTMLIQLMAWICDNLAVRQDLIYNESFLATATSDSAKRRLLKQIGYSVKSKKASVIDLSLEFKNVTENDIYLSNVREDETNLSEVKNKIYKFYGNNINGKAVPFEILKLDNEGRPDYTYAIKLPAGDITYTKDSEGNKLTAIQGNTIYKEFESDTNDGPIFELANDLDIDSIKVYDVSSNNILHKRVDNFIDTVGISVPCYIVEQNDEGKYQIRYPSKDLMTYDNSNITFEKMYTAGSKVGVFYRSCEGSDSNIVSDYINISEVVEDANGDKKNVTINNVSAGYYGRNMEELNTAVKNAPLLLTSLNRAVTSNDYDRILKENSLVLNAKSFTPDNAPDEFENYYGRKIQPHEVFSFLILNRNINDIPKDKLNYYPWINTIKNNVLNEKYIFGNANMNTKLSYDKIIKNCYVCDNYDEYSGYKHNSIYDHGQWYYDRYEVTKDDETYDGRLLKNGVLFKTSGTFGDLIVDEKNTRDYSVKIAMHNNSSNSLYIKDINNIIGTKDYLTTNNNILKNNVNASYTSLVPVKDKKIDCINYKYLKFVLDDTFVISIDLHKDAKDLYDTFKSYKKWNERFDSNINYYMNYYLSVDNDSYSDDDSEYNSYLTRKYGDNTTEYYKAAYAYHNSEEYAKYRRSIIQLIKEELNKIVSCTKEIDYDNPEGKLLEFKNSLGEAYNSATLCGKIISECELKQKVNDNTYIYSIDNDNGDKEYFVIVYETLKTYDTLGKEIEKVLTSKVLKIRENENNVEGIESLNATEDVTTDIQSVMYNSKFADNSSSFVDIGLQEEDQENNYSYLKQSYIASEDAQIAYYEPEEKKDFYRIRINDRIFAVRLDAYSVINAYNYYLRLSINNNAILSPGGKLTYNIYDYFPYFGKGDLKFGIKDSEIIKTTDGKEYEYKYEGLQLTDYNTTVAASLEKIYNSGFSKRKIAENKDILNPKGTVISYNTTKETDSTTENIASVQFNLRTLANVLEYIFSPINIDKNTIFEYKNGKWYDLKTDDNNEIKEYYSTEGELTEEQILNYRNVLNGKIRFRNVKKANYPENRVLNVGSKITNQYDSGYEYDLRIEAIDNKELTVSSVAENEILYKGEETVAKVLDKTTKDLIESIFGSRKKLTGVSADYINNIEKTVLVEDDKLKIVSQNKGLQSSLYFIKTINKDTYELINELGLIDGFAYEYEKDSEKVYYNRTRSVKAVGQKIIELYIGDNTENTKFIISEGVNKNVLNAIHDLKLVSDNHNINIGDIICTSSDINYSDFEKVYISYILSNQTFLKIDKQDNFYYSNNEKINDYNKPPIVCIDGASVDYDAAEGFYYINNKKSNFKLKLTSNTIDTNNYNSIKENEYEELRIARNYPVTIETNLIDGSNIDTTTSLYSKEEIELALNQQVPFIFSVDSTTNNCCAEDVEFEYDTYKDYVLAANPGVTKETSGWYIYKQLISRAKQHINSEFSNNCYSFANLYYNTINKLVLSGLDNSDNGNITFYFPDVTAFSSGTDDLKITTYDSTKMNARTRRLAVMFFYRMLFGTNITNKRFYDLFPKEEMIALNSENIVASFDEDGEEYFYCPDEGKHLKFIFRTFVDKDESISKYGDYYIGFENKTNGFNGGYDFYLRKTERSEFPDKEFYLHFVNDRTYEVNRNVDEDIIKNYMKNYQIIGTELNILKPYFKTFDLKGTVKYNSNFELSTIKLKVENALKEKYSINSLSDIEVGNNVYRSDIFKTVLDIDGVESFELEYFGYNYLDQTNNPDQKYSLNISNNGNSKRGSEFYIVSILADSSANTGIIFEYEPIDVETE